MAEPEHTSSIPPERRSGLRVPVRRVVRAAIGLRSFEAQLMDLSISGCRLRCPEPVTAHGSLWIVLPAGFGGRFPLPLRGEVARAESVRGEPTGVCDVALRFRDLSSRASERLWAAVGHVLSPPPERSWGERRRSERRWFGRRVVARIAGQPRVLIGQDLSTGGMRARNAAGLAPGQVVQLALHSQAGDSPLVLRGRVLRCDERGEAAFAFLELRPGERMYLENILAGLPSADAPVVAEIVEQAG